MAITNKLYFIFIIITFIRIKHIIVIIVIIAKATIIIIMMVPIINFITID